MNGRPDQPGERVCERALVWHLGQFRLEDHAALFAAARDARMVFPLVVRDHRDPLTDLAGYGAAVRTLARDYASLGAPLLYLEGDSSTRVLDAARDARADYVYVLERTDAAGRALLEETCEALGLWGFRCRVFSEADPAEAAPASLAGAALPGLPLPPGPLWDEEAAPAEEARALGRMSSRARPAPAAGGKA